MTRRVELLDELAALRDFGDTPRIDTTHNRLDATGKLLALVEENLETLHVLAYDRYTAHRELSVAGGSRDYALDTHGDPRARKAYKRLAMATIDVCEILAEAAHDVVRLVHEGDRPLSDPVRTVGAEELAEALEAKASRVARGEFSPPLSEPQPEGEQTEKVVPRLRSERDALKRRLDRIEGQAARPQRQNRGWRKTP